jgi:hypothetical protein
MGNGIPYNGQGNYNPYGTGAVGTPWFPNGRNFDGPQRPGIGIARTGGNIGAPNPVEPMNRLASPSSNPRNK